MLTTKINNGEYKQLCKLGEGSGGEIYSAKTLKDEKEVVLKVFTFDSRRARLQFIREASISHKLCSSPLYIPSTFLSTFTTFNSTLPPTSPLIPFNNELVSPTVNVESVYYNDEVGVIVMEKMECDLMNFLQCFPAHRISEPFSRHLFLLLSLSLYHCHSLGISHLDLKPDNILLSLSSPLPSPSSSSLSSSSSSSLTSSSLYSMSDVIALKLADFGYAADFSSTASSLSSSSSTSSSSKRDSHSCTSPPLSPSPPSPSSPSSSSSSIETFELINPSEKYNFEMNEVRGTREYLPPEAFNRKGIKEKYRGDKADTWALGVTLFAMITGNFPYAIINGHFVQNDFNLILRYTRGDLCFDLLAHLLHPDPSLRYDIHQVLLHPWLSSSD